MWFIIYFKNLKVIITACIVVFVIVVIIILNKCLQVSEEILNMDVIQTLSTGALLTGRRGKHSSVFTVAFIGGFS